jgi:membrane associated rhomboid family serine protease
MLPLADERSRYRIFPWVTNLFIFVNVGVFLLEISRGQVFVDRWAFVPNRFLADPLGDSITLITSMFMHGGWLHLISNMLYLWIFGDNIEGRFGHLRFILFYLLSGVGATLAQLAVSGGSDLPFLGASGAIAGVLGAYLLLFPSRRVRVLAGYWIVHLPAFIVIGVWFLLQLLRGFTSFAVMADTGGIAYAAHVGGFISGLLLVLIFRKK